MMEMAPVCTSEAEHVDEHRIVLYSSGCIRGRRAVVHSHVPLPYILTQ